MTEEFDISVVKSIRSFKLYRHSLRLVTLSLFFRESEIKVKNYHMQKRL
ncbi:MAG: hypothetical protein ACI4QN_03535 [Candidatus Coproplasma sp.]